MKAVLDKIDRPLIQIKAKILIVLILNALRTEITTLSSANAIVFQFSRTIYSRSNRLWQWLVGLGGWWESKWVPTFQPAINNELRTSEESVREGEDATRRRWRSCDEIRMVHFVQRFSSSQQNSHQSTHWKGVVWSSECCCVEERGC